MPTDPAVCRWCGCRLRRLLSDSPLDHCDSGCAKNDQAPFVGHCQDCHREFRTGAKPVPPQCFECAEKDRAALKRSHAVDEPVYSFQRFKRGRYV